VKDKPPTNGKELHNAYKAEIEQRVESLSLGSPKDFAEYQKLVGVITGLRVAEQMLKALLERENNDDDDYSPPGRTDSAPRN
jgi:hypothetical protein